MTKVHLKLNTRYFKCTFDRKLSFFKNKSQKFNQNIISVSPMLIN